VRSQRRRRREKWFLLSNEAAVSESSLEVYLHLFSRSRGRESDE